MAQVGFRCPATREATMLFQSVLPGAIDEDGSVEDGAEHAIGAQSGARQPQNPRDGPLSALSSPAQPSFDVRPWQRISNWRQVLRSRCFLWSMDGLILLGVMFAPLFDDTPCTVEAWKDQPNFYFKGAVVSPRRFFTGEAVRFGVPQVGQYFGTGKHRAWPCASGCRKYRNIENDT